MNITIICGFFESTMQSYRENQFALRLASRNHNVRVITSDQSFIWKFNRARVRPTNPSINDDFYRQINNLALIRRKPYFRLGDLVMFPVRRNDFLDADVVHVLDFRQGITARAARLAMAMGKPVVYDHEQRGDRIGSPLHAVDNFVRRCLIRYGAEAPSLVRHTVISNRRYFETVAPRYSGPFALSPLGVNETVFFKSAELRRETRRNLGLEPNEKMFLFTGKIDIDKRPASVMEAANIVGSKLFIAGKLSPSTAIEAKKYSNVIVLGEKNQTDLNALYNAADFCIFTTFSLSYWESLSAGANVIVPATHFSQAILKDKPGVLLFGEPSMFAVEEERYHKEYPLATVLQKTLSDALLLERAEVDSAWIQWDGKIDELEQQYAALCSEANRLK